MRIECEQCHQVGYLQILGNYARVRHYDKIKDGRSTFYYHQISKTYSERCLSDIKSKTESSSDQCISGQNNIEHCQNLEHLENLNSGLDSQNKEERSSSSLVRTLAFQASDPGFESRRPHQANLSSSRVNAISCVARLFLPTIWELDNS